MKKKIVMGIVITMLSFSMVACAKEEKTEEVMVEDSAEEQEEESEIETETESEDSVKEADTAETQTAKEELTWPEEFAAWGVPTIETATVKLADNRSSEGDMMTQGINAIVNLSDVSQADFDAYCVSLEGAGFQKEDGSLAGTLLYYNKTVEGGEIEIIASFDGEVVTISVHNSAATAIKDEAAGGEADWPEAISGVPEFTKGKYKETVDMGGNMFTITYLEVTPEDVEAYESELLAKGFISQEMEDSIGYMKQDGNTAYSVGIIASGDSIQLIVYVGTY